MSNTETVRRSVVLKQRPDGAPRREDFDIREDAIPQPAAGDVVTRTIWLSIDPYMRADGCARSRPTRSRSTRAT